MEISILNNLGSIIPYVKQPILFLHFRYLKTLLIETCSWNHFVFHRLNPPKKTHGERAYVVQSST